jgi:hypothetical protein
MERFIITPENLTRAQILALRAEAFSAGDVSCADLCDQALMGIESARERVAALCRIFLTGAARTYWGV